MKSRRILFLNLILSYLLPTSFLVSGCDTELEVEDADAPSATMTHESGGPSSEFRVDHDAVVAGTVDPAVVLSVAQAQFRSFLGNVPEADLFQLGFDGKSELENATFADPYEMFQLTQGGEIAPLLYWRIPVVVDGEFRSLIDVRENDGHLEIMGVGAENLAAELFSLELTAEDAIRTKSFLRSYQARADFVVFNADLRNIPNPKAVSVNVLRSAQMAFPNDFVPIRTTVDIQGKSLHTMKSHVPLNQMISAVAR